MANGLLIAGSHGVTQIDEKYRNLFVRATGTGTFPSLPNQGLGYLVDVNVGTLSSTSIVGVSGGVSCVVVSVNRSTGNVSFFAPNNASQTFTWWVFDKLTSVRSSGRGLKVVTPNTHIPIFDDAQKPMRVVGQYGIAPPDRVHNTSYSAAALPSGKTICWLSMNQATNWFSGPSGGPGATTNFFYVTTFYQSGSTLVGHVGRFTSFGGSADVSVLRTGRVLGVDVTGY